MIPNISTKLGKRIKMVYNHVDPSDSAKQTLTPHGASWRGSHKVKDQHFFHQDCSFLKEREEKNGINESDRVRGQKRKREIKY